MARPQKAGIDYFPLDTNIDQDDKVALIEAKYGIVGFGVIIKMYKKIYATNGYYYDWNEQTQLLFSKTIGLDVNKIIEIIDDSIRWELFDSKLYKKYKILTSKRIQKTYLKIIYKRKEIEIIKEYIANGVNDIKNLENVIINSINDSNNTQSKVKESKEENSKEDNIAPTSIQKSEPKSKIVFNFENEKWEGITDKDLELFGKAYPAAKLNIEFAKMKAWILSAGAKGRKSNWRGFITRWLNNCQDRGGTKA